MNYFNQASNPLVDNVDIDKILENEKQTNKNDNWNKLDKTMKIQKLHSFAEKYGKDNSLPIKTIKTLKAFFIDCLEKNKLLKTKEVLYDKEKGEITSIPTLTINNQTKNFTLRQCDKRVSTLKSLTPKRVTSKNTSKDSNDNTSNSANEESSI
tara:strand:+ start:1596 stop:2054 length:459 start_codon:yes stop_codon:yes gene_type:complete